MVAMPVAQTSSVNGVSRTRFVPRIRQAFLYLAMTQVFISVLPHYKVLNNGSSMRNIQDSVYTIVLDGCISRRPDMKPVVRAMARFRAAFALAALHI